MAGTKQFVGMLWSKRSMHELTDDYCIYKVPVRGTLFVDVERAKDAIKARYPGLGIASVEDHASDGYVLVTISYGQLPLLQQKV